MNISLKHRFDYKQKKNKKKSLYMHRFCANSKTKIVCACSLFWKLQKHPNYINVKYHLT